MKLLDEHIFDSMPKVATIGFFDGVHLGHNYLLEQLKSEARERGMQSMVVTFATHPRLFFNPDCGLRQLTLANEKRDLLATAGLDNCLMLQFNKQLSSLTSAEFMRLLVEKYGVKVVLVGYDHHFGCDRDTAFEGYVEQGQQLGIEVRRCAGYSECEVMVSSSKVRKALELWDVNLANRLLGYNYSIRGTVVEGKQIGRKLGFPTANLQVDALKILPSDGVYVAEVFIGGEKYKGVLNIGKRPTISAENRTIEVHIIGFTDDLYGKEVELKFVDFLRHEQKFSSLEALKEQIKVDIDKVIL